jgi:hypothetical protein
MSATAGPKVPCRSGIVVDLFDPSSPMVTDRLAVSLMRDSFVCGEYRNETRRLLYG